MPISAEYDKVFCVAGRQFNIKKLLLKSIGLVESNLDPKAFRHEPLYWERYMKNDPLWADKDPQIVSSSHGICQIMFLTAWNLGLTGEIEKVRDDLLDPTINITLAAKLMRQLIDKAIKKNYTTKYYWLSPLSIALAMWNGGGWRNPDENGVLRNQKYVRKVLKQFGELRKFEKECDD